MLMKNKKIKDIYHPGESRDPVLSRNHKRTKIVGPEKPWIPAFAGTSG